MEWLNYHHLYYFWMVARMGSITAASEELQLAQPTISSQLRALEKSIGHRLFQKKGRNLVLTELGRMVFSYTEEIFALGRELRQAVRGRPRNKPMRFHVGIADVLPKLMVYRLLQPVFHMVEPVQVICTEGKPEQLLAQLVLHELDLVLTDAPLGTSKGIRAYQHLLGECGLSLFGTMDLVEKYRDGFPESLDGAPMLLPLENTHLRRNLDNWFTQQKINPVIKGEFADSALLKVFGATGIGLFPVATAIEGEVEDQFRVVPLAQIDSIRVRFFAFSVERKLKHPAVLALTETARQEIFS